MTNGTPTLLLYCETPFSTRVSYYLDWREAFLEQPDLNITPFNISPVEGFHNPFVYYPARIVKKLLSPLLGKQGDKKLLTPLMGDKIKFLKRVIKHYELIILLHSTNADKNELYWLSAIREILKERRGKILMFIGNEYTEIDMKLSLINELEIDFIATQLERKTAEWLYADCPKSSIILAPHALNERVFISTIPQHRRKIDIGFIGDRYGYEVGDIERTRFIDYFIHENISGLIKDIRVPSHPGESTTRLPRYRYIRFLNKIKGTIGTESGTMFLDKSGQLEKRIHTYIVDKGNVTFDDVYNDVIKPFDKPLISAKAISSRHFEAIGTKTCQILLEGHYNGILEADKHYLCIKKDYSNFGEVVEKFKDNQLRERITNNAYEYVMEMHTYRRRVKNILEQIFV